MNLLETEKIPPSCGIELLRGPYLQIGTDSSMTIRWATATPTDSQVRYGFSPACLDRLQTGTRLTCEHQIQLNELEPDHKYYYAIGTAEQIFLGGDENYYFVTAPSKEADSGPVRPLRVWVLGDCGRGNEIAAQVRDGYLKSAGSRHTDLWLMLGDNAYEIGTVEEYQRGIFEMYPQLLRCSPLWTAIGNHDAGSANSLEQSGPYYELFSHPKQGEAGGLPSGTAAYYSFDYGNLHLICLDSFSSDRSPGGAMLTWLEEDVSTTERDWTIAFWHHPPYTKGSHDSDTEIELIEMREWVLPLLEEAGVDLVLCGHSHSYERSYLIDGHYGFSHSFIASMKKDGDPGLESSSGAYHKSHRVPHGGTVYIVAGTSALAEPVISHPAMQVSLSLPGSLILDAWGKKLDLKFIDLYGEVRDRFTLKKS